MGTWNKDAMSGEEIHELYKKSVWALQILPGCTLVKGHSIADLALKAYAKVVPYLLQNKMDPLLQIGERIKPSGAEGRPKKEGFLDFLGLPKEQPNKEDEDEDAEKEKEGEGGRVPVAWIDHSPSCSKLMLAACRLISLSISCLRALFSSATLRTTPYFFSLSMALTASS